MSTEHEVQATTEGKCPVAYDPLSAEILADPFPVYAELRERCPVHHFENFGDRGFFTVSRHEDVLDLSKRTDAWSAEFGQGPIYVKEGGLRSDPPEHTIYRRLITGFFTPSRINSLEPEIRQMAEELVDGLQTRGRADIIEEFAAQLPLMVVARIVGVPLERRADFIAWTEEFMAGQNAADPEVQGRARARIDEFFTELLEGRRALISDSPSVSDLVGGVLPDDAVTSLMLAEHEGKTFTNEQLLPLLLLLLVGGIETTRSLIGNLVFRLVQMGLWNKVSTSPEMRAVAIEESLRFDPPVLGLFRTANGDQELHGVPIPNESKIHGLYASANRDAKLWDDAEEFRLDRDVTYLRRNHLSFGAGIWVCPAANLARLEAEIAMDVLGSRLSNLRFDGPSERAPSFMMWGLAKLPVTWD